ncbi:hypothetical protein, partial [Bordetella pertussis]
AGPGAQHRMRRTRPAAQRGVEAGKTGQGHGQGAVGSGRVAQESLCYIITINAARHGVADCAARRWRISDTFNALRPELATYYAF